MSTLITEEQQIWKTWRAEVAPWHLLPDGRTSLDCLVTEVGEAVDARLRHEHPNLVRTSSKPYDLGRELAQIVDLAYATAIGYGINLDAECAAWRAEVMRRMP